MTTVHIQYLCAANVASPSDDSNSNSGENSSEETTGKGQVKGKKKGKGKKKNKGKWKNTIDLIQKWLKLAVGEMWKAVSVPKTINKE